MGVQALGKPALADVRLGLATAPVLLALEQYPQLAALVERRCEEPCAPPRPSRNPSAPSPEREH